MDVVLEAIVIGIVQGLTEFLPISSSAHLIVIPPLLGWDDPFLNSAEFDVMLHLGTLVALVAYFWRDLWRLFTAWLASMRDRSLGDDPDRRLAWLLVITTIPAALIGALFEDFFDETFRDTLLLVPVLLLVGAALLAYADRVGRRDRDLPDLRARDAAIVGVAQALALFPGISRSGVTIATGLLLGLERPSAARFAFLIGVPVTAGAVAWKLRALVGDDAVAFQPAVLVAGVVASAISGFLAIRFLLRYLRDHSMAAFVWYRVGFAALVAVVLLTR